MGSLTHFSSQNKQEMTEIKQSKIPDYAKEFKAEWLYIRGINKKCEEFLVMMANLNFYDYSKIFHTSKVKKLIKILKWVLKYKHNINKINFKFSDINGIDCFLDQLDNLTEMYFEPDSFEFDQEAYNFTIDLYFPNFRELYDLLNLLFNQLKVKYEPLNIRLFSDEESD